jgi:hypothetical protein
VDADAGDGASEPPQVVPRRLLGLFQEWRQIGEPRILLGGPKRCVDKLRAGHVSFAPPSMRDAYREARRIGVDEGLKLMGPVANIDLMGKHRLW